MAINPNETPMPEELGGPVEELIELLRGEFAEDEWRRFMARQQGIQTQLIKQGFGIQVGPEETKGGREDEVRTEIGPMPGGGFLSLLEPTTKAMISDRDASASTELLGDDLVVDSEAGILRATVAVASTSTFEASIDMSSGNETVQFNEGNQLNATDVYTFDLPVTTDWEVNYELGSAVRLIFLYVQEINAAAP